MNCVQCLVPLSVPEQRAYGGRCEDCWAKNVQQSQGSTTQSLRQRLSLARGQQLVSVARGRKKKGS